MLAGALASLGCAGWVTANGGHAYTTAGRLNRDGPLLGTDQLFTLKGHSFINKSPNPLPFGLHNSLQAVLAPDFKSFMWGTGIAVMAPPRPISGYAMGGTQLHFDAINGHFSVGNFHPYAELGLAARIGARDEQQRHGPLVTFGLHTTYLIHYIVKDDEPRGDGFVMLKFGFGWETE